MSFEIKINLKWKKDDEKLAISQEIDIKWDPEGIDIIKAITNVVATVVAGMEHSEAIDDTDSLVDAMSDDIKANVGKIKKGMKNKDRKIVIDEREEFIKNTLGSWVSDVVVKMIKILWVDKLKRWSDSDEMSAYLSHVADRIEEGREPMNILDFLRKIENTKEKEELSKDEMVEKFVRWFLKGKSKQDIKDFLNEDD